MRKKLISLFILSSAFIIFSGCTGAKYNLSSLFGRNLRDLRAEENNVIALRVESTSPEVFQEILLLADENDLVVYQKSLNRGFIVLMGFERQIDTTRVGVFFTEDNGTVNIELRSLSSAALRKAEKMLFDNLKSRISN